MTPAKTHQGERLGVSPPCRPHRRPAPRSPQLAANRKTAGLCFELHPTSGFRDSQRWTRRADAQPLAGATFNQNPDAIIRTLCAFANDFENLGGGYVVIGQDCNDDGTAIFPPVGLPENQLDLIQRELLQYCQMIQPTYFGVLSIEQVEGRHLIVLWAPGGLNRPYKAPRAVTSRNKEYHYFIRRYRNRRIGEFLKELDLTEGRCTGIPRIRAAMERNGSPEPRFSTDEWRTHFLVELPVHPEFVGVPAHDEAHDEVHDRPVS